MLPLDRLVATCSLRLQKLRCSFNFLIACRTTVMSYIYIYNISSSKLNMFLAVSRCQSKKLKTTGDPKTKFLRLLFSAVHSPSIRPTKKLYLTLPLSNVRCPTWGQSYKVGSILFILLIRGPHQEVGGQRAEGGR